MLTPSRPVDVPSGALPPIVDEEMTIVQGELFPDPASQTIRAEGKEISVEILRPWHQLADVDLGGSGSQLFQRKPPGLIIIARNIEPAEFRRPDQGGEMRGRKGGHDRHFGHDHLERQGGL